MYAFEDLESVHNALNLLAKRDPSLVKVLPRQPGTKESRYAHLLSPLPESIEAGSTHSSGAPQTDAPGHTNRVAELEAEIARLRSDVSELQQQFAEFRKQFD
jgi:hypothetical protein